MRSPVVVGVVASLLVLAAVPLNTFYGLCVAFYGEGCSPGGAFRTHLGCRYLTYVALLPWMGLLAGALVGLVLARLAAPRGQWNWPAALVVGASIYALALVAAFMFLS